MDMDKFHPITTCIGLVNSSMEPTLNTFLDWQNSILDQHEMSLEASPAHGNFEEIIKSLLPLTAPISTRFAFIPTKSKWIAYFDNGRTGTDAASVMRVLANRLRCDAIRVVLVSKPKNSSEVRYEACILEHYNCDWNTRRSIYAVDDGGKWKFGQSGEPYPFEEIAAYSADRIRDRFTPKRLCNYLENLDLRPFKEGWYVPSKAWRMQKKGKLPSSLREYELRN